MKILIVSTYEIHGGAAIAANHLHKALQSIGVESEMLVKSKTSDDPRVLEVSTTLLQKSFLKYLQMLDTLPLSNYRNKQKTLFSPAWVPFSGIVKKINASDADLVHLHWVAQGIIRIEDLAKIKKPIVWSLHDMWVFTGGCHYDNGCGKYTLHCGACPLLASEKSDDLSNRIFERKVKTFAKIPGLTIIGLSQWLADCAKNSTLLAEKRIVNLPNPIDINTFRPLDRGVARDLLDLPMGKKLILFGADDATRDPRKGFAEFSTALKNVQSENLELVIFGSGTPMNAPNFYFPVHHMGHLPGDILLRTLYSAVDVMVVPSLQENLSNTIMESLACGTPVVAFNLGGNIDLIDHQQNGYLATPFDPASLAEGIDWVLNHPNPQCLSQNARQKVMENFEATHVAQKYQKLYENVLECIR